MNEDITVVVISYNETVTFFVREPFYFPGQSFIRSWNRNEIKSKICWSNNGSLKATTHTRKRSWYSKVKFVTYETRKDPQRFSTTNWACQVSQLNLSTSPRHTPGAKCQREETLGDGIRQCKKNCDKKILRWIQRKRIRHSSATCERDGKFDYWRQLKQTLTASMEMSEPGYNEIEQN